MYNMINTSEIKTTSIEWTVAREMHCHLWVYVNYGIWNGMEYGMEWNMEWNVNYGIWNGMEYGMECKLWNM